MTFIPRGAIQCLITIGNSISFCNPNFGAKRHWTVNNAVLRLRRKKALNGKNCGNDGIYILFKLPEKCKIEETQGFLKERCPSTPLSVPSFKCPFSDEYYYVIFSHFTDSNQHPFVNATCSEDPYGYQVNPETFRP